MITFLIFLLSGALGGSYQQAFTQASIVLSASHDDKDSMAFCGGKLKAILLRDSVLNRQGSVGMEYNYPIYKYETEIVFYENGNLASIETRMVHLKRYSDDGVTTGIQINKTIDASRTFYFNQEQQTVKESELLKIEKKICALY